MYNSLTKPASISVTILTKNSSKTLGATLDSLKDFLEVIVLDSGSSDSTKEIATSYPNVKFIESPFLGFGKMHNYATKRGTYDWILSIDSDEVLTAELSQEILSLDLDPKKIYELNRCNYFWGKWMKCCSGWYPDPVIRLYNRKSTSFTDDPVHEKVINGSCQIFPLKGKLIHTPYRSIDDFLYKMQLYSTLFAEQNKGKNSSLTKAIVHGFSAFFKSYILKRGFLGGKRGFIISLYNSHTAYYKYLKLAFAQDFETLDQEKEQIGRGD